MFLHGFRLVLARLSIDLGSFLLVILLAGFKGSGLKFTLFFEASRF